MIVIIIITIEHLLSDCLSLLACNRNLHGSGMTRTTIAKTIFQGTLQGGRRHGRQRKRRMDNVKELMSLPIPDLLTTAFRRKIFAESSLTFPR